MALMRVLRRAASSVTMERLSVLSFSAMERQTAQTAPMSKGDSATSLAVPKRVVSAKVVSQIVEKLMVKCWHESRTIGHFERVMIVHFSYML